MIKIYPSVLSGSLNAPASKADAQRILFASALPNTPTTISNVPDCRDTRATAACLESFGCKVKWAPNGDVVVEPFPKSSPVPTAAFDFKDSATSARFSMALAAAFGIKASCRGSSNLTKRHMLPLTSRMALRGINMSGFSLPLEMQGRLEGGFYQFRGDEGSQFISALLMALPLLLTDSVIELSSPLVDGAFIDITIDTLKRFGIVIEKTEKGFKVPGRQLYVSPGALETESDWGLSAAWICGSALGRNQGAKLTVTGLAKETCQNYQDLQLLISLISQDFQDLTLDMSSWPDLMPLVAAAAALKGGRAVLSGAPQLKTKETNRLKVMAQCIRDLGGTAIATEDGIEVQGPEGGIFDENTVLDCMGDPWIFFSFALSCAVLKQPVILKDESCATKICQGFLDDFARLGGKYEING